MIEDELTRTLERRLQGLDVGAPDLRAVHRDGIRLRRGHRVRVGVATVLVLLVAVGGWALWPHVGEKPAPVGPPRGSDGATSYPQRISYSGYPDRLPARTGPLSALVTDNNGGNGYDVAIGEDGGRWKVPAYGGGLISPDGTRLVTIGDGYGQGYGGAPGVHVHDLVSGNESVFDQYDLDDGAEDRPGAPRLGLREATWSPDGQHLSVTVADAGQPPRVGVLDLRTGRVRRVPAATGTVAGFVGDSTLVSVEKVAGSEPPRVHVVDLESGRDRVLSLRSAGDFDCCGVVSVSPDGRSLAVGTVATTSKIVVFDLTDGRETGRWSVPRLAGCPIAWRGDDPVVATKVLGSPVRSLLLDTSGADGPRDLVAVNPLRQSFCLTWAADAIAGDPQFALLGTAPWWWTFYVTNPFVVALLLAGLLYAATGPLRRRLTAWRYRRAMRAMPVRAG